MKALLLLALALPSFAAAADPVPGAKLGSLVFDDGTTIALTQDDLLWSARLINGETWGNPKGLDGAAMLWSIAQRSFWRGRKESMATLSPLYSQPINKAWSRDGAKCDDAAYKDLKDKPTAKGVKNPCSKEKLDKRDELRSVKWDKMSQGARDAALDFAQCKLDNPLPGSVGWLATNEFGSSVDGGAKKLDDFNDNTYYASTQARSIGGKKRTTDAWTGTEVKVVCDAGKTSGVAVKK